MTFLLHSQHPQHNSMHKTTIPATWPQKSYGNIQLRRTQIQSLSQSSRRATRMLPECTGSISLSWRLVSKHESDLYWRHTLLNPTKHGHQTVNNTITTQDSTHFPGIACDTGLLINRKVSSSLISHNYMNNVSSCYTSSQSVGYYIISIVMLTPSYQVD